MILLLATLPLYRLLGERELGLAGQATARMVGDQVAFLWSTTLLLLIVGVLGALLIQPEQVSRWSERASGLIHKPKTWVLGLLVGVGSFGITALVTDRVFGRMPNLIDGIAQLTHARYMAAGHLGGPADLDIGFWHVQNMVLTEAGWFSQYPPGHALILAGGMVLGQLWLTGPVLMGVTAALLVPTFERLLPDRVAEARIAAVLAAFSPLLLVHAATYMNHVTAALLGALALYFALRSRDGGAGWAIGAGAAVSVLAAVRPLTAVVMMTVVLSVWLLARSGVGRLARLCAGATLGGLPFLIPHLLYNRHAFGSALTFGYDRTWGPSHSLGFGTDPWGNPYGPIEALLYTSAELSALNLNLLEIPLPLVALIGVFLLMKRCLGPGEKVLALWALLPLAGNFFYWHHGYHMGPRMLAEHAPAWVALAVLSACWAVRSLPEAFSADSRLSPRGGVSAILVVGVLAGLVLGPDRVRGHGSTMALDPIQMAVGVDERPPLVFVHGGWEARLVGRLAEAGIRLDEVETALRQNPTCLVHQHWVANEGRPETFGEGVAGLDPLDLDPRPTEWLPRPEVAPGIRVRMNPEAPVPEPCLQELRADRFGGIEIASQFWRGGLPGAEEGRPLFARDLGPEANARLMASHSERSAFLMGVFTSEGPVEILPYHRGIQVLWDR